MTNSLTLGDSLLVTLIGMIIVFFGLTVLIFLIKALIGLTDNLGKKKAKPKVSTLPVAPPPPPVKVEPAAMEDVREEDEAELIAVITAALMCVMEEGTGFRVRHVRRVTHAPAWQRAGREEQIYSHF